MVTIGVLALQGGVQEHIKQLQKISDVQTIKVKKPADLEQIEGLILPGGESTTISKLIRKFKLKEPIINQAQQGLPIWGTCAGLILLAHKVVGKKAPATLNLLNITAVRNAYGSQLNSFTTKATIEKISSQKIPLTFIRAPYIQKVGPEVQVLLSLDGKVVAVEEKNLLATAFHPELNNNLACHKYFIQKIKKAA